MLTIKIYEGSSLPFGDLPDPAAPPPEADLDPKKAAEIRALRRALCEGLASIRDSFVDRDGHATWLNPSATDLFAAEQEEWRKWEVENAREAGQEAPPDQEVEDELVRIHIVGGMNSATAAAILRKTAARIEACGTLFMHPQPGGPVWWPPTFDRPPE
jgi:hypothetical protein